MVTLDPDDEVPPRAADGSPRPSVAGATGNTKGTASSAKTSAGNEVHASGPGSVCIFDHDDSELMGPMTNPTGKPTAPGGEPSSKPVPPSANPTGGKGHAGKPSHGKGGAGKDPASAELKLTYVEYARRMDANSKENMVRFWEDVRVLNMPCKNPDIVINLDAILATTLPEKAMFLRCGRLQVLDHPTDGKPNKQMEAHDRVYIQGREFYAPPIPPRTTSKRSR